MKFLQIGVPPGRRFFGYSVPGIYPSGTMPGYSAFGNSSGIVSKTDSTFVLQSQIQESMLLNRFTVNRWIFLVGMVLFHYFGRVIGGNRIAPVQGSAQP
ncbi:MAG: hypothetical protein SFY68_15180 [Candidatus Sumerlaeia bacterium]|nr:hypothetical protein [Candidatus Sumerlaeia bacterium]